MGILSGMFSSKKKIHYEVRTSSQDKPRYFKTQHEASDYLKKELEQGSGSASMQEVPIAPKKKKLMDMS